MAADITKLYIEIAERRINHLGPGVVLQFLFFQITLTATPITNELLAYEEKQRAR